MTALDLLAEEWLTLRAISARDGEAGNSMRAWRGDLDRWGRALAEVTGRPQAGLDASVLTTEQVLTGLRWHLDQRLAPATVRRSAGTMRAFCRWLVSFGHLASDPTDSPLYKAPGGISDDALPFRAWSPAEVQAMLVAAANPPERRPGAGRPAEAWPARDVAVLEVLAGCGLRAAELCGLQRRHIDLELAAPLLHVVRGAKGAKRRDVPIPPPAERALRVWLDERGRVAKDALLFIRGADPLTTRSLDTVVRRTAASAGVAMPGGAAAHAYRHYYASQLILAGVPLAIVQQLLGHSSAATTAIYTAVNAGDLVVALASAGVL